MPQISLLDCTLRDGGFINDWQFGEEAIHGILTGLTRARIDIIEVGFLNAARPFDKTRTVFPDVKSTHGLLGKRADRSQKIVAMIDYGTCPISHICAADQSCLDGIRVIFKKGRMYEAIAFCRALQELGYLVFVQPVSVTDYTPKELAVLLSLVNALSPHAVSIVDTYGLLGPREVVSYFAEFDRALAPHVSVGYHAHNNLQLGFAACQALCENALERAPRRALILDATLLGMGKSAGNTPLELLAHWQNADSPDRYDVGELLATVERYVLPLGSTPTWGYQLPYFLAAAARAHPSYVEFLKLEKGLGAKEIFLLLKHLPDKQKLYFSREAAQKLYSACMQPPFLKR
ncbi:MAG: aldolase catalytic domain-containing protein [Clostridia bacterium]|nr:aldolase catalytic domain-containing protein [Clostridia bacterium]